MPIYTVVLLLNIKLLLYIIYEIFSYKQTKHFAAELK